MRKRLLYAADPRWAATAKGLDKLVSAGALRRVKDEGRTCAGLLAGPEGATVFIKRVRTGSWMRGLVASVRGSRVKRWLGGAAMLEAAGFNRPAPLCAFELRRVGAVIECYLACEFLSEASVLSRAVFGREPTTFLRRRALLKAVAREVRRLHDAGLYTRDLQETNLMIEDSANGAPRIWFVDLEDFRRVSGQVSWHLRLTNLVHLDRSLGRFMGRTARMRFLYDYLGVPGPSRVERRKFVVQLLRLRARVEKRRRSRAVRRSAATPISPATAGAPAAAALTPPAAH